MSVIINGVRVSGGTNFSIIAGSIYVDGQRVELTDELQSDKVFNIMVEGNVERIDGGFAQITVQGDAQKVKTMSGDVSVTGNVTGDVNTMSGDITVGGSIHGNAKTMSGDIRSR